MKDDLTGQSCLRQIAGNDKRRNAVRRRDGWIAELRPLHGPARWFEGSTRGEPGLRRVRPHLVSAHCRRPRRHTLSTLAAAAQQPGQAITIVVPYTPGTGPDILARLMGEEIQVRWGQPVVVENKPGASGNFGTQVVARAPADGNTLLLTTSPFTQNISLFKCVPCDPVGDFAPIVHLSDAFMALAVHPSLPVSSAQGLVDYLKAHRGQVDYASPGRGTLHHLSMELFKLATGTASSTSPIAARRRPCRTWWAATSPPCSCRSMSSCRWPRITRSGYWRWQTTSG